MVLFLRLGIIVPDGIGQFLGSPLCSGILCTQVTVCVEIQNYNAVAGQMIVGNQFFIQKQVAIRHVNIIFRDIRQFFLHIPHGIIAEITDQTAGKIRRTRNHRCMKCGHMFLQKGNGLFYCQCLRSLFRPDLCLLSGNADFLLRGKADK